MRWFRSLRRRVPIEVWYHPAYRLPLAPATGLPISTRRADDALTWALHAGLLADDRVHEAPELSWADAALVHDAAWLESLDRPEVVARILAVDPRWISVSAVVETWRRAAGGTVAALAHVAAHGGRAVNLLGGFHHAEPSRGAGFCAINDVAVAVARLRRTGFRGPIAIIDLDAHPPDGLVACLGDDPETSVLSLSVASAWTVPDASAARVLDRRIPPGTSDGVYLAAVDALLAELGDPALVVYLAGADPLAGDPLGGLAVSLVGLRERDRRVFTRLAGVAAVTVPAGGYTEHSWRVLAGTVAEAANQRTPIPERFDPGRHRTARVASLLDPRALGADAGFTDAEILGELRIPGLTQEPRFLGYYTRHGLEHALEQYGYLPTIRRLGFCEPVVELRTGEGPDRLLIRAPVSGTVETLVDLAVSIRPLDRFRVLFVEWLELRDPRSSFTDDRPALPGQSRRGLGLAEETGQLLLQAAERLSLDGVSYVPAHWHVAWMSRGRFTVVDPDARGRVRAIAAALGARPLLEASALLSGPGLATPEGPVRWEPVQMVCPRAASLADWLGEGEGRAEAAERQWRAMLGVT